jgi:polysaccharide export outer membrane protein
VSGLTVEDAQALLAESLSNKQYRQTTGDGREIMYLIQADQVFVSVGEYRPIYVYGDVARPGEYIFRPGLTVRQAVAIAGGYGQTQLRGANPLLEAADFRSDYEALLAQFAAERARMWRIRTELGEDVKYVADASVPKALAEQLKRTATEHVNARLADSEEEKAHLRRLIEEASRQLTLLAEKKKQDEEGAQAATEEYESVRQLFQKGLAPTGRLSEARRAVLYSSTQVLDTIVQASNIERQRGEYTRQLQRIDSERRIAAWADLQESYMNLAQISARLDSAAQKLALTGQPQPSWAREGEQITMTVHRKDQSGPVAMPGSEDLELAPGDVVEIRLDNENFADAIASPTALSAGAE